MIRIVLAALLLTAWAEPTGGQGCTSPNCSEAVQQPPNPLTWVCLEQRADLADLVRQQDVMIERLEAERDELRDKLAKASKPRRGKCKPGRTRNARGICGRWG